MMCICVTFLFKRYIFPRLLKVKRSSRNVGRLRHGVSPLHATSLFGSLPLVGFQQHISALLFCCKNSFNRPYQLVFSSRNMVGIVWSSPLRFRESLKSNYNKLIVKMLFQEFCKNLFLFLLEIMSHFNLIVSLSLIVLIRYARSCKRFFQ